jgi:hypothetical protein
MSDLNAPIYTVSLNSNYLIQEDQIIANQTNDIVLIASNCEFDSSFIGWLASLLETISAEKHSRIIVAAPNQYETIPSDWIVVPTQTEAEDMIEMDRIERDLGF